MEKQIRLNLSRKSLLSPRNIGKTRNAPSLNLPSLITESINNNYNNKKLKKVSNLFSYLEPSSISERGRTINLSNIGLAYSNGGPQIIPYKEKNSQELLNLKMSKLIQFKSISKELNEKGNVIINARKRKKPKFSSDLLSDGTKLNTLCTNTTNNNKSRNYINNVICQTENKNNNQTNIKINNNNHTKKSNSVTTSRNQIEKNGNKFKQIVVPKLVFSSFSKNISNNTSVRNNKKKTPTTDTHSNSKPSLKMKASVLQKPLSTGEASTNGNEPLSPANPNTKPKKPILKNYHNNSEIESLNRLCAQTISSPRTEMNKQKIKSKIIGQARNLITSSLRIKDYEIKNPYRAVDIDLTFYKASIIENYDYDSYYLFDSENIMKSNLLYLLHHLSFSEIQYIIFKYFDCYNELADEISFNHNNKTENNLFTNFERKLPKTNDLYIDIFNEQNFDVNNQAYVNKFIVYEHNKYSTSNTGNDSSPPLKKDKNSIKKKRCSSLYFGGNSEYSSHVSKSSIRRVNTFAYNFNRATFKLSNFSLLKNKRNFYRLDQEKLHRLLHPQKKNENTLKNILGKVLVKAKNNYNYMKKNSKISQTDLYNKLLSFLMDNHDKEFIKLFVDNKNDLDINVKFDNGNTFLILATKLNEMNIVKFLLENGADINAQNLFMNTALHYATSSKHYNIVNLLIQHNANEEIKNKYGENPWECLVAEKEEV